MKVGSMTPAQYEDFRREYPHKANMAPIVGATHATKTELRLCKQFFATLNSKVVINRNSAYFADDRDAVLFKIGMWLIR